MKNWNETDIIVVGAGHAGCEAALAAARLTTISAKARLSAIVDAAATSALSVAA